MNNMPLIAAQAATPILCHSVEGRNPESLCVTNAALRPPSPFRWAPIQIYIKRASWSALCPTLCAKIAACKLLILHGVVRVVRVVRLFSRKLLYMRAYVCVICFFVIYKSILYKTPLTTLTTKNHTRDFTYLRAQNGQRWVGQNKAEGWTKC